MSSKAVIPPHRKKAMIESHENSPLVKARKREARKRMRHFNYTITSEVGLTERIFTDIGERIKALFFAESEGLVPFYIKIGPEIYSEPPIPNKAIAMPLQPQLVMTTITEQEYEGNLREGAFEKMRNFDKATFLITNNGAYVLALYRGSFNPNPQLALEIFTDSFASENLISTGGSTFEYLLNVDATTERNGETVGELQFLLINPEKASVIDALQRHGEENVLRAIDAMRAE